MVIASKFSTLFIYRQFSVINYYCIVLQVKSKSPEKGSKEKIELQVLSSRLSKQEEPFTATEEDPQPSRRDSPEKTTEPSTSDKEHIKSDRSPLIEPSSRAEARSRSVEDLPKKPKTFKFRDSKSSDV